jgi:methylated-DNA-[protein]-cysteine S-methyltransferase
MMSAITTKTLSTPYGELILGIFEGKVCLCDWKYRSMRQRIDERLCAGLNAAYQDGDHPVLEILENQLFEYFRGERKSFNLELTTVGTDFQKDVWTALQNIDYGKTETYGGLARKVGRPEAVRATGSANGANAISIIIPCHRIVGSGGSLGGYAGGVSAKGRLLALEGQPLLDWGNISETRN